MTRRSVGQEEGYPLNFISWTNSRILCVMWSGGIAYFKQFRAQFGVKPLISGIRGVVVGVACKTVFFFLSSPHTHC